MTPDKKTSICFVGLENIPVLAREYNHHGIGGEQVQQTLIAKALSRRGYQVSMVVGDYGQQEGQIWDGVTTHKAYKFKAGLPILRFLYPRLFKLWTALKRADAKVYYVSCAGPQVGVTALFAKIYGRSVVFRIAIDSDCDPKNLLIRFYRDKKLYEYGLRNIDYILAQSKKQQLDMLCNYQLTSTVATMLVENRGEPFSFEARDIPILWVNNLRQIKRPDIMLALAKAAPGIHMHMIGGPVGGFEELYTAIERQSASISNLTFHGQVPYHDVGSFYARTKIFVNTSDLEGFPNSYLQAWMNGTPVIAFFDPDNVIAREGLGRSVRNFEEMKVAVNELLSNPTEWNQASNRCLAFMQREYGEDRVLAPYIEAIDQLAQRK